MKIYLSIIKTKVDRKQSFEQRSRVILNAQLDHRYSCKFLIDITRASTKWNLNTYLLHFLNISEQYIVYFFCLLHIYIYTYKLRINSKGHETVSISSKKDFTGRDSKKFVTL